MEDMEIREMREMSCETWTSLERWKKKEVEKREFKTSTPLERQQRYLNIPIKNRDIEKLIDPDSYHWQKRYYKYFNLYFSFIKII